MAIQSMTGFGRGENENENFTLSVEVKTVNHRFKDIRFKMGNVFNSHEITMKKEIEKHFSRGSFDIYVNYKKTESKREEIELDMDKIKKFVKSIKQMAPTGVALSINPTEFIRADFYKENVDRDDELLALIKPTFSNALEYLMMSRIDEGDQLVEKLKEHQEVFTEYFDKVVDLKGTYQEKVRAKLHKRFETDASGVNIDEPRFLQEVIYYLEKLDIDEEVNRISIHLQKLTSILESSGEIGRQIDFLIQELNRETNTIGSKSGDSDISENIVQMKVQLEKIREQALNLQ